MFSTPFYNTFKSKYNDNKNNNNDFNKTDSDNLPPPAISFQFNENNNDNNIEKHEDKKPTDEILNYLNNEANIPNFKSKKTKSWDEIRREQKNL